MVDGFLVGKKKTVETNYPWSFNVLPTKQLHEVYYPIHCRSKINYRYRRNSDFETLSHCLKEQWDIVSMNEILSQCMRHCLKELDNVSLSHTVSQIWDNDLKYQKKTNSGTLRRDRAQAAVPACVQTLQILSAGLLALSALLRRGHFQFVLYERYCDVSRAYFANDAPSLWLSVFVS
jgi:hypothetical protein